MHHILDQENIIENTVFGRFMVLLNRGVDSVGTSQRPFPYQKPRLLLIVPGAVG